MSEIVERHRDILRVQEQLEPFREVQQLMAQTARETRVLAISSRELSSSAGLMASGMFFSNDERSLANALSGAVRDTAWLGDEVLRDALLLDSSLRATQETVKFSTSTHDILAEIERASGSVSPIIAMMGDAAKHSLVRGYLDPALTAGFGKELLAMMVQAGQVDDEQEIADFLAAFLTWLLEQARRMRGLVLTPAVVWSIFLTVLQILLSQIQAGSANERLMDDIRSAKEEIISELRAFAPPSPAGSTSTGDTYRVVVEETELRTEPSRDSDHLRVLPPHLVVQEMRQVEGWSFVQFFDYVRASSVKVGQKVVRLNP